MLSPREIKAFNTRLAAVEERIHAERKLAVGYVEVLGALMAVLKESNPENICAMDLPEAELARLLEGFPFAAPSILAEIDAPELAVPGSIRRVYRAMNVPGSAAWMILRNDADPFPSNPHAHNEVEDLSLDLSDGKLYHDREFVRRLRKEVLIAFRERVERAHHGIGLPVLAEPW